MQSYNALAVKSRYIRTKKNSFAKAKATFLLIMLSKTCV